MMRTSSRVPSNIMYYPPLVIQTAKNDANFLKCPY